MLLQQVSVKVLRERSQINDTIINTHYMVCISINEHKDSSCCATLDRYPPNYCELCNHYYYP
jgi:hypothetical protein